MLYIFDSYTIRTPTGQTIIQVVAQTIRNGNSTSHRRTPSPYLNSSACRSTPTYGLSYPHQHLGKKPYIGRSSD